MIAKIIGAVWADTWFCNYCGNGFNSYVEMWSHMSNCDRNPHK